MMRAILVVCLLASASTVSAAETPLPQRFLELRALLQAKRYGEIERQFADLLRRQARSPAVEDELDVFFYAFKASDAATERDLNAWVAQSPRSPVALAARSSYHERTGWLLRGEASAAETSDAQFRRMSDALAAAVADCEKALALKPDLLACHVSRIYSAVLNGERARARQVYEAASRLLPESLSLKTAYLVSLTPRWGGSRAEIQSFLDAMARDQPSFVNGRGRALMGFLIADLAMDASIGGDARGAMELYSRAIEKSGGQSASHFAGRARNAYRLRRFDDALADFNQAITLEPYGWPHTETKLAGALGFRAILHGYKGDLARSQADLAAARTLDENNADVRYAIRLIGSIPSPTPPAGR